MKIEKYMLMLLVLWMSACTKPVDWTDEKDSVPPGPVSNVTVENLNGGAKISYMIPADNDLLGVKIQYSLEDGKINEKYASPGNNFIMLEGFGDTKESSVTIYAVDKSGNTSEGIPVTIKPLVPPISLMRESLLAEATFGGIKLSWDNEFEKEMGISLFVLDSATNEMKLYDNQFSESQKGSATFRGFDATKHKFQVALFDRWNNYAEALDVELTPLAEQLLPGRNGGQYIWNLYDDNNWLYRGEIHNDPNNTNYSQRGFQLVHDGVGQNNSGNGWWNPGDDGVSLEKYIPGTGTQSIPFPLYFTVDMGKKAVYSRFNIKPRLRTPDFSGVLPVDFEIWGSNDPKLTTQVGDGSREANMAYWTSWSQANGTDTWENDGWVKLATCKLKLSSGDSKYYEGMPLTDADIQNYRVNGFDFDVNEGVTEGYRYLRWVIKDTNTGQKLLQIAEINFWGTYTE